MSDLDRRAFGRSAAVAAGTLSALSASARAAGSNERVRLGIIGVGNRGDQLLSAFLPHKDCEIVSVCDVFEPYLVPAQTKVGGKATLVSDYRRMLDAKDIDAIIIATPDHWHALQFIEACRAGKHVYVEKPTSLTIGEGKRMVEVAKETKRITQVGFMRRSSAFIQEAVELIRGGAIGKVTSAKCTFRRNEMPMGIGNPADGMPPPGLNWDSWLGPAPKVPFNENRCLYKFRWFGAYSGGQVTNQGAHYIDVIQWALGQDAPKGCFAAGGKYAVDDNRDIPDTMEAVWQYDSALVTYSQYNANGASTNLRGTDMEFRGTTGTLYLQDGFGWEIVPESNRTESVPALSPIDRAGNTKQGRATKLVGKPRGNKGASSTEAHARNFLDAIRKGTPTTCPIEVGHRSTSATILAKMALACGRYLAWDAAAEQVVGDDDANKLLNYEYRAPYQLG
ncbi:Gfo/Idh/MocA family protein [Tuwongella immobilis]|uniref:Gfo/Idh/MocA-like oxidoreductase N-terminal domain-containing protein n=1 Tax=Tuwongella immobilis TaxID=692036 RepID=A0A6C2YHP5_9BACT|nr:Gfo/Idh/MocA family oxidoreductase [Tuwongella immobilis]VIP00884.1 oxidoreductase domain-containing protein : Oxidoreductase OS=uncultured prokaryote GN=HGMM_F38G10C09 PE=4 SV=1: GFO_IDH_MocA: GFO_IDH_MocA_C [Tuwongella immobilis]VTR97186.1 oxidoreductase domain-containing protein : Oxidoreductase OS=uncultured prokaryote GN=HGMM_F38G10C09 PE=4 SV=1: GFO_IDH_MocA: GFO_IDH_MocA_C [Tuwongella immobilis]